MPLTKIEHEIIIQFHNELFDAIQNKYGKSITKHYNYTYDCNSVNADKIDMCILFDDIEISNETVSGVKYLLFSPMSYISDIIIGKTIDKKLIRINCKLKKK